MRLLWIGLFALLVTGCAANKPLYQWGNYDALLYEGYKNPANMEAMRIKLEAHIGDMEKSNQRVAPGLYAELGTLYLQSGDSAKAIAMYSRERDTWPESKGLMTAMIQNLERQQKTSNKSADAGGSQK